MRKINGVMRYSPTDLTRFYKSPFASQMERLALDQPELRERKDTADALMARLQQKGYAHEDALEAELRGSGLEVLKIVGADNDEVFSNTVAAMQQGVDVIVQARLQKELFSGFADFLVIVDGDGGLEGRSTLGAWHYEVWDTKLASKANPSFVLQLCCYAEMLESIQGCLPQKITVALGSGEREIFRTADFYAYYLNLKSVFLQVQQAYDSAVFPDPAESASHGDWSDYAAELLKQQDHLSLVATMTRGQAKKLEAAGISTLSALAESSESKVTGLNPLVLQRLRRQAAMQKASEGHEVPQFEVIENNDAEKQGLQLLPPHSPRDAFFDIEGFPLDEGGLEYLWGCTYYADESGSLPEADFGKAAHELPRTFIDFWAHDRAQEKVAFESFIHWVYQRWLQDTSMHIYHYANYEIAACRKLMGRFGSCEYEVDQLLRNEVFVDLYKVVKGGLVVGEPRYSIKNIEKLYRGTRETDVSSGGDSVVVYDLWREAYAAGKEGGDWQSSEVLKSIRDYNIDDCDSTQELVLWLRERQSEAGITWPGKTVETEHETSEEVTERTQLRDRLLAKAEVLAEDDSAAAAVRENLAWLLEFHRREAKPVFWRLFDRLGLSEEELVDDAECLAGCVRTESEAFKPTPRSRNLAYEYQFDVDQEFKGKAREFYVLGVENKKGKNLKAKTLPEHSNLEQGLIVLQASEGPPSRVTLVPDDYMRPDPIPAGITRVASAFDQDTLGDCAIADFLMRAKPRMKSHASGAIVTSPDSDERLKETINAVRQLDNSYLPIQGPPGSGKTYTATRIIADLLGTGARIGISSNSHNAINNLLMSVSRYCAEQSIAATFFCTKNTDVELIDLGVSVVANGALAGHVQPATVIGTTAWGFSRDDLEGQFDYLFVDEAGQVSVANLVGMSGSARNLVLLGDQMQLGQPVQGTHPARSGLSVLDYLMDGKATIESDRGVFLPTTYRMHSEVNRFISDHFYDGKLGSHAENDWRVVKPANGNAGRIGKEAGIVYVPVEHEGNSQGSDEEAAVIADLVQELLGCKVTSKDDAPRALTIDDILCVAPYNMQVNKLQQVLPEAARVGSVDRFQGREAPVVILSLCASDASESPRGLSFLLDRQRMNVALSRAQSLAIVVASPSLAFSAVSSVEQMRLVNLFSAIAGRQAGF